MRLTDAVKGEPGAMYPVLAFIHEHAEYSTIVELPAMAGCLESVLISHAAIEDAILRPPIEEHLAVPPESGRISGTDGPPGNPKSADRSDGVHLNVRHCRRKLLKKNRKLTPPLRL